MTLDSNNLMRQKKVPSFKIICDYAHTYPDYLIRYHESDMSLYYDTDAAILVQPNS